MLLRGSSEHTGEVYDYAAIRGEGDGGGIAHGAVLIEFAEAVLGDDEARLTSARDGLAGTMGAAAMIDSAAVVAIFESAVRIADATGIPLEDAKKTASVALRADLGIDDYPGGRASQRTLARR